MLFFSKSLSPRRTRGRRHPGPLRPGQRPARACLLSPTSLSPMCCSCRATSPPNGASSAAAGLSCASGSRQGVVEGVLVAIIISGLAQTGVLR